MQMRFVILSVSLLNEYDDDDVCTPTQFSISHVQHSLPYFIVGLHAQYMLTDLCPTSWKKTSIRRRSRIPCVVVEKNTTRRREDVGVVVEKNEDVDELSTKIRVIYL